MIFPIAIPQYLIFCFRLFKCSSNFRVWVVQIGISEKKLNSQFRQNNLAPVSRNAGFEAR